MTLTFIFWIRPNMFLRYCLAQIAVEAIFQSCSQGRTQHDQEVHEHLCKDLLDNWFPPKHLQPSREEPLLV